MLLQLLDSWGVSVQQDETGFYSPMWRFLLGSAQCTITMKETSSKREGCYEAESQRKKMGFIFVVFMTISSWRSISFLCDTSLSLSKGRAANDLISWF